MKTYLVIHHSDHDVRELMPFVAFARDTAAHLNVVMLGTLVAMPITAMPGAVNYYYDDNSADVVAECKTKADEVEALLQKEGVSGTVSVECSELGSIDDMALRHALFADAALFANRSVVGGDAQGRCFNGALITSGRPVLVQGEEQPLKAGYDRALLAWNGEPEVARAMHHCVDWLAPEADVEIVVVDPDDYRMGPNAGDDAAHYLARQGYSVNVDQLPSAGRSVAEVLNERARDTDADLVVMGAYSRSRFREWLLGGTTRQMLGECPVTLLMAK